VEEGTASAIDAKKDFPHPEHVEGRRIDMQRAARNSLQKNDRSLVGRREKR
jgi:hypothetical protein